MINIKGYYGGSVGNNTISLGIKNKQRWLFMIILIETYKEKSNLEDQRYNIQKSL